MKTTIVWFRRDLRLGDHPALHAAVASADRVVPVFVVDPALDAVGAVRLDRLRASLTALDRATGGALVVRRGEPGQVLAQLSSDVGADTVHISAETTPFGRRRDDRVGRHLAAHGVALQAVGSPYAVTPGRVLTGGGTGYRVFTPFARAWRAHGWREPLPAPSVEWHAAPSDDSPWPESAGGQASEPAGEAAALARLSQFLADDLDGYADSRDRPDLDATSRLSIALKYGEIHPRTVLAACAAQRPSTDLDRFVTELAWREFYADVLWHAPSSAWSDWKPGVGLSYDEPGHLFDAWCAGQTGYPLVDAGMRQLLAEGWMHNRVRMVTASFLAKDLHVWWPHGARHFLTHLRDGDVASNNHGWQWTAGTGTDASPYFRVFNPVAQGTRFDPSGDYLRRWIPELRHLPGASAHEPWKHPQGYEADYPQRIVDHATERLESLARYEQAKQARAEHS